MLEDRLKLPFETMVLGVGVLVERIDLTAAEEIVAVCRRGRNRQALPILELPLPTPSSARRRVDRGVPSVGAREIERYGEASCDSR